MAGSGSTGQEGLMESEPWPLTLGEGLLCTELCWLEKGGLEARAG